MKKIILRLGCLCLLVIGGLLAGTDEAAADPVSGVRLGVEGGINLGNFNGPYTSDGIGSRAGFAGGGFLDMPLIPGLNIQPEILYEQKGGKFNGTAYQLDYVEIPILLDIALVGAPLAILVGPSFDNLVGNVNNVNNTDIGVVLGGQVNLDSFLVSGRYEFGLLNVFNVIQNSSFTVLVGMSFI
jgi:hypothetical protein